MKNSIKVFFYISFCLLSNLFAQQLPQDFYGLWEGKDRFVFFEKNSENQSPELVVLLKTYYGWYYDRVSEPESYGQKVKRERNTATTKEPVHINILINKNLSENNPNAIELLLEYSNSQKNYIPLYLYDDKIYLDFYVQNPQNPMFYQGNIQTHGLMISPQAVDENITAFIIDQDKIFNIRYWKSNMLFSDDSATFNWEENDYYLPKHIYSGQNNYSCVNGRAVKIRNIQAPEKISENYNFNSDKSILILDKEAYLIKLMDYQTLEDYFNLIAKGNSRRKPEPPPLFGPDDLNWHWDVINQLQKDNPLIQEVRKRQKDFANQK